MRADSIEPGSARKKRGEGERNGAKERRTRAEREGKQGSERLDRCFVCQIRLDADFASTHPIRTYTLFYTTFIHVYISGTHVVHLYLANKYLI